MSSYRSGFIGLIGQPNAGKSSLMNYLIDEKVSIVTSKPQTTRRRVHGLWSAEEGQIILVDAPGVVKAESGLNSFLMKEAESVIKESDALWAVVSLDEQKPEHAQEVVELVAQQGKPWMGIVTKSDLQEKSHRILILKDMIEKKGGKAFSISILRKDENSLGDRRLLLEEAMKLLPQSGKPLFDKDIYTTQSVRDLASEVVREKCFQFLHHEIPYSVAVRVLKWDETSRKITHVSMEIIVAKEAHKGMVIGKSGSTLKQIGSEARKEIEKICQEKIFLDLKVSFKEAWQNNPQIMKELGYVAKK